ncbi:MAG: hypothetical protein JNK15_22475 [Planctomycetes bacterium]|nr:hypothetical protein [Planctomycetota bacterium]
MQRRSVLFLSLALVSALVVVSLQAFGDEEMPPAPSPQLDPSAVVPVVPEHQDPAPAPALPAGAVRVRLEVTPKERYAPPPATRAESLRPDGTPWQAWVAAGVGAGFDAAGDVAGACLVAVEHDEGRVLRQAAMAAGVAHVRLGARRVVRGRVVGQNQLPLMGAKVWFGEHDTAGKRREFVVDGEGNYDGQVLVGEGVPFVVSAAGHATSFQTLAVVDPPSACDAVLERACLLEVQLVGAAVAMQDARAFVLPPPGAMATAVSRWPFFVQALTDGYALDANGRVRIDDLPQTGEVAVLVRHPRAPLASPKPVALKGTLVRAQVPTRFEADVLQGVVVDEAGMGRPGVWFCLRFGEAPLPVGRVQRLLPPHLDLLGSCAGVGGDAGEFAVGVRERRRAVLSLRAFGCAGRDLPLDGLAPDRPLVLPTWRGGEPELRVSPPQAGVPWWVDCNLGGGVREGVAADTPFRVSLPHAGRFDIVATTFVGDREVGQKPLADVHATGPVDVDCPRAR